MKENFVAVIEEINHTLNFLANTGCTGFDCSSKNLEIVKNWGKNEIPPLSFSPDTLEKIYQDTLDCRQCRLFEKRKKIVFGTGNSDARLMFIGGAPADEEDNAGEPFVGEAGQLLTKIIQAIHLTREQVYITNIIKCHPPGNRNPQTDEIKFCLPFLKRQISAIKPEVICALGLVAAQTLLDTQLSISDLRGNFFDYNGIKLIATFEPEFLLRHPEKKRDVWEDMKKLMKEYG